MRKSYHYFKNLLLLIALTVLSAAVNAQNAWINEIHYDDGGADANELVEIVIENPGDYTISLFSVILYNGSGGASYDTRSLSAFTLGSTVGNYSFYYFNYTNATPPSSIQNGAPDGLALIYNGAVISGQFLSYEGTFTATNGLATGMTSISIGVSEIGSEADGLSLQLSGSGTQYSSFTWQTPATATAGALNNGQTFGGIDNPIGFNAATISQTQINLSWQQNLNSDNVMIATNSSNSFGTPAGVYAVDDLVGTATVIYIGPDELFSHTGLTLGTEYFYKAWSVDGLNNYSPGLVESATTQFQEPSSHPTEFTAINNGPVFITVSWTDSDADHYLVKGSNIGYSSIVPPVDGVGQGDSLLVKNIDAGLHFYQFKGLTPNSNYYFKIYPYNGTGEASNYKTDGSVQQTMATTDELDIDLIISEVADPVQFDMRFVELFNFGLNTIDFSIDTIYFCRQSNGSPGSWGSLKLTGILPAGETYLIALQSSTFDTAFGLTAEKYSNTLVNNNGNDGVFLFYGGNQTTGYLFDAYGVVNEDGIGDPWFYEDGHAVRRRNVTSPNSTWTANEWAVIKPLNYKNMTPAMHAESITWQGTTSAMWNYRSNNWSGIYGWVPDASCIVTIPTGVTNFPIITEPSACDVLMIQSNTSLSIQSTGSLLIVGP